MAGGAVSITALDGSQIAIRSSAPVGSASSLAEFYLASLRVRQQFQAGRYRMAETFALDPQLSAGAQLSNEYLAAGGRLRLGSGEAILGPDGAEYWEEAQDGTLRRQLVHHGAWQGRGHSVYFTREGGELESLIDILSAFEIDEREDGVVLTPADPSQTQYLDGPSVVVGLPGLIVEARELTAESARGLPSTSGTVTATGSELFVANRGEPKIYFVLVSASAYATIARRAGATDEARVQTLDNLSVDWNPA